MYIRCVRPNGLKMAAVMEKAMVVKQLRVSRGIEDVVESFIDILRERRRERNE